MARCSPAAIAVATAAILVGTVLGAWNCYRVAELRTAITFPHFLSVFWRSWAIGITLPGQVADLLTTLWQLKGRSNDLNFVAGRLIADKAITLGLMLAMLALLPVVFDEGKPLASVFILAGVCTGAVVALAILAWCQRHPNVLAGRRWGARIVSVLAGVRLPVDVALGNAFVTCIKLVASGCAYWVVLKSIAPNAPGFIATTVISQTAGLIAYLPISFNGLGTVEVSAVAMFGAAGLDSASVLSAYLILRAITMAAAWLPAAATTALRTTHPGH